MMFPAFSNVLKSLRIMGRMSACSETTSTFSSSGGAMATVSEKLFGTP